MTRLMITLAATAARSGGSRRFAAPAVGPGAAESVAEIIVYGNDPCPRSTDDQVVVCARRPETERYRIPEKLPAERHPPADGSLGNKAQGARDGRRDRDQQLLAGRPGGYTGCLTQVIKEAREQRKQSRRGHHSARVKRERSALIGADLSSLQGESAA